jgi:hypothetical protein
MKYSESNKPLACMMTTNPCYKNTYAMTVLGVLWHSTGANNPNLKRYVQPSDNAADRAEWLEKLGRNAYGNDWNHITTEIGVNAFLGKLANGTITTVQTMPWNYRPWGCAGGSKGSCNNGWIQFEICEDALNDKAYFDAVYKEACELTAYLCKLYNLNPHGTVTVNGVEVPVILCHADSYKLGMGSNHSDVYHWFNKYGKTMANVRDDVAALMKTTATKLYRIRKAWDDVASQKGAYAELQGAIEDCKGCGKEYKVFDSEGKIVYSAENEESAEDSTFSLDINIAGEKYVVEGELKKA